MSRKLMQLCAVAALVMCSLMVVACEGDGEPDESSSAQVATTPQPAGATATNSGAKPASPYHGAIDYRDCESVRGWVWNGSNPNADIKVELYIDGKVADTQPAKTHRPDLKSSNLGTGNYGFSFKLPATSRDNNQHTVSAKVAGSDYTLPVAQGVYAAVTCKP